MEQEIAKLVSGLEPTTADYIQGKFNLFFTQAKEWKIKAEALVVTDVDQVNEMKMAREGRLALKNIRVNANKTRQELKQDSIAYGRAVQSVYNVIEELITPIEKHLEKQEKYAELKKLEREAEIRVKREDYIDKEGLREYIPYNIDLGTMVEDDYDKLIKGAELQKEDKAKEERKLEREKKKVEKERLLNEENEHKEKLRIQKENDELRKEVEQKQEKIESQQTEIKEIKTGPGIIETKNITGETGIMVDKTEYEKLLHHKDSSCGLWCTDIDPKKLFEKAMTFKSDSNPFEDGGECMVKDGYKHCENSLNEYFTEIFFQLEYK